MSFYKRESVKKQGPRLDCGFHSTKRENTLKRLMLSGLMAGVLLSAGAWAETAQQARMKSCNAEAGQKSLSGDARKSFMKSCLSGK
jgi:formate/nitrite transporter FocA (FNT family)